MILLDTSALVDSLTGSRRSARKLRDLIEKGERILIPTLGLFEWLRGPRRVEELVAQEALFPRESAVPFGPEEAVIAAEIYGCQDSANYKLINCLFYLAFSPSFL